MSGMDGLARRVERVASFIAIGGRTFLSFDTNPVPAEWQHVTKVDPEDEKRLPLAFHRYLQHTDAVSVGGSRDVTDENTEATFQILDRLSVPTLHEPSAATHVTERTRKQADFLAIPEVLNGDSESLVGTLGAGIEYVKGEMVPSLIERKIPLSLGERFGKHVVNFASSWLLSTAVFEAYIIQNPDSAAAREASGTKADLLSPTEAKRRAMAADLHLESEICYLEYSGTFGGSEAATILEAISDELTRSRLWYGGGITNREQAERMLMAGADTVVVGNVFHEIANEERDLCLRAAEAFDELPDVESLQAWTEQRVDRNESAAVRYLDTIPSTDDPEAKAVASLTHGVYIWLALCDVFDRLPSDPTPTTIVRTVEEDHHLLNAPSVLGAGESGKPALRAVALGKLAEAYGLTVGDAIPGTKIGPPSERLS